MPIKIGTYSMTFMVSTGNPPFPVYTDASLTITVATPPTLAGTISVPKLGVNGAPIEGIVGPDSEGTTTFNFATYGVTPQLDGYGMQIDCGGVQKLMGGTNITNPPGLPAGDPNEDACWVATHSGAGDGDDDEDDRGSKGKYGR